MLELAGYSILTLCKGFQNPGSHEMRNRNDEYQISRWWYRNVPKLLQICIDIRVATEKESSHMLNITHPSISYSSHLSTPIKSITLILSVAHIIISSPFVCKQSMFCPTLYIYIILYNTHFLIRSLGSIFNWFCSTLCNLSVSWVMRVLVRLCRCW